MKAVLTMLSCAILMVGVSSSTPAADGLQSDPALTAATAASSPATTKPVVEEVNLPQYGTLLLTVAGLAVLAAILVWVVRRHRRAVGPSDLVSPDHSVVNPHQSSSPSRM